MSRLVIEAADIPGAQGTSAPQPLIDQRPTELLRSTRNGPNGGCGFTLHVHIAGATLRFHFRGKSGLKHQIEVTGLGSGPLNP